MNHSSRDILEEVIQTTHIHLDSAINQIQFQMDEKFDKATAELEQQVGQIHIRMGNDKQIDVGRYESIMSIITKLAAQKEQ